MIQIPKPIPKAKKIAIWKVNWINIYKKIKQVSDKRKDRIKNWWSEKELFKEIWKEREHKCQECWVYIHEPKIFNFAHIKSKWKNPKLRLEKQNILIKCFACHYIEWNWWTYKGIDLN
jgi:hypothetical protein